MRHPPIIKMNIALLLVLAAILCCLNLVRGQSGCWNVVEKNVSEVEITLLSNDLDSCAIPFPGSVVSM